MDQVDVRLQQITNLVKKFMKELLSLTQDFEHVDKGEDAYKVKLSDKTKKPNG